MYKILFFLIIFMITACNSEKSGNGKEENHIDRDSAAIFDSDSADYDNYPDNNSQTHDFDISKNDNDIDFYATDKDLISDDKEGSYDAEITEKDNDNPDISDEKDDEKNDEFSDSDISLYKDTEYAAVPSAGGEFTFFEGRIKIFFPENWSKTNQDIGIREIEKQVKYEFIQSPDRFLKPLRIYISIQTIFRAENELTMASFTNNQFIRLNRALSDDEYVSADVSFPIVFSTAPRGSAVCPGDDSIQQETRNIYSEIVYNKNHQIVTVDMCMDRFEASLVAGIGDIGNADQSVTATAFVTSSPDEIPLSKVSYYQARQLCQNVGKELCGDLEWQVACEGAYNPHESNEAPCFFGLAGSGCYNFDETLCHLKSNHEQIAGEYDHAKYQCNLNFKYCTDADAICQTELTTCLQTAEDNYNNSFRGGNFPFCHSVFEIDNMVGNLNEWISYQNIDGTFREGVLRGGGYTQGGSTQSDLKCRPENEPGFQINPLSQLETVGFRCCIL